MKKKTPAPRRAGNGQAAALARRIRLELSGDMEALAVVRDLVRILAARSRVSRRRN